MSISSGRGRSRSLGSQLRLEQLNAVLRAVRNVNQLIVREKNADTLVREACRLLVDTRGYRSAWVARMDDDGHLRLVGDAGLGDVGQAFRSRLHGGSVLQCANMASGQPVVHVVLNSVDRCADCPMLHDPEGWSCVTVRLEHRGTVYGLLGLSVQREYVEEDEEIDLLREVGEDIAFALDAIREADLHKRAVEQLRREHALTASLVETSPSAIVVVDRGGSIVSANAEAERILGLERDLITQRVYDDPNWHIVDYDGNPFPEEQLPVSRVLREGRAVHGVEHAIQRPSGERVLLSVNAAPLRLGSGEISHVVSTLEDVTEERRVAAALRESEARVRKKLDAVLQPEGDISGLELADVLDVPAVQALMDEFSSLMNIAVAVLDLHGNVLVATGWQDVCTRYHRMYPATAENCTKSDLVLSQGVEPGTFRRYRCKNMMWDMSTPLIVGGTLMGNIYLGQFFFDDEKVDLEAFRARAKEYGFDEQEYLTSVARVPRWSHEMVDAAMRFHTRLAGMMANSSYGAIKLARTLAERDETLRSLRKSEQSFRSLFESMLSGFVLHEIVLDSEARPVDLRFLQVNPAFEHISGWKSNEVVGRTVSEVSPDVESVWLETYGRVALTGEPIEFERYSPAMDKYLRIAAYSPEIGKVAVVFQDITERREKEEQIRSLAAFPAQNPNPVLRVNEDGVIVFANEASGPVLRVWGVGVGEELPLEWQSRVKVAGEGKSDVRAEVTCGERVLEMIVAPLKDGGVNLYGLDVTERKRLEEILRASEERYRALFEQSVDAVYLGTVDGSVVDVNQRWLDLFGYTREDMEHFKIQDVFIDPDDRVALLRQIRETGIVSDVVQFKKKDGTVFYCQRELSAQKDGQGNIVALQGINRDVTEARAAEQALQASEEKFRSLFEQSMDAIYSHAPDGSNIDANQAWLDLYGYSREELPDLNAVQLYANPADRRRFLRRMARTGYVRDEVRFKKKDGSVMDCQRTVVARKDERGNVVAFQGVIHDITEQKRAGDILRQSEQRFHQLFVSMTSAFALHEIILDVDGRPSNYRFLEVNPAFERLTGLKAKDVVGRTVLDVMPATEASWIEIYGQVALTGEPVEFDSYSRALGKYYEIAAYCPAHGTFATVFNEVTEHKRALEELRGSEGKFRSLFEQSMDAIYITRPDGSHVEANKAWLDLFGYTRHEMQSLVAADFYENPKDREHFMRGVLEAGSLADEARLKRKNGTVIDCQRTVVAQKDVSGSVVALQGMIRDVTVQKRVQKELQESLAELERVVRGTLDVIEQVVEVRDPYTAGHERRVAELSAAIAHHLGLPEESCVSVIRVAAQIHDVGKISVPVEILSKPGRLSAAEFELIKSHPQIAYDIIRRAGLPDLVADVVLQHHERLDGSGYPNGLSGDAILPEAQILAVADVVEAMSSHRPYRPSLGIEPALEEVSSGSGIRYDADVVAACLAVFREGGFTFSA